MKNRLRDVETGFQVVQTCWNVNKDSVALVGTHQVSLYSISTGQLHPVGVFSLTPSEPAIQKVKWNDYAGVVDSLWILRSHEILEFHIATDLQEPMQQLLGTKKAGRRKFGLDQGAWIDFTFQKSSLFLASKDGDVLMVRNVLPTSAQITQNVMACITTEERIAIWNDVTLNLNGEKNYTWRGQVKRVVAPETCFMRPVPRERSCRLQAFTSGLVYDEEYLAMLWEDGIDVFVVRNEMLLTVASLQLDMSLKGMLLDPVYQDRVILYGSHLCLFDFQDFWDRAVQITILRELDSSEVELDTEAYTILLPAKSSPVPLPLRGQTQEPAKAILDSKLDSQKVRAPAQIQTNPTLLPDESLPEFELKPVSIPSQLINKKQIDTDALRLFASLVDQFRQQFISLSTHVNQHTSRIDVLKEEKIRQEAVSKKGQQLVDQWPLKSEQRAKRVEAALEKQQRLAGIFDKHLKSLISRESPILSNAERKLFAEIERSSQLSNAFMARKKHSGAQLEILKGELDTQPVRNYNQLASNRVQPLRNKLEAELKIINQAKSQIESLNQQIAALST